MLTSYHALAKNFFGLQVALTLISDQAYPYKIYMGEDNNIETIEYPSSQEIPGLTKGHCKTTKPSNEPNIWECTFLKQDDPKQSWGPHLF